MASVSLPDIPTGEELEDYVAAFLQCGGFYTEKSLIERGETEVMELDIMAWKPVDQPPQHTLFEVKGGSWGFSDIFKVYGWKTYLQARNVSSAYLIGPTGSRPRKTIEYMEEKCRDMGLNLIAHSDLPTLRANFENLGLTPKSTTDLDHSIWRFSFWLERQIQKVVTNHRKFQKERRGPDEIYAYQEQIRNGFLQAQDVRERLATLYRAHLGHRLLAKSVAAELDGGAWNAANPLSGVHWNAALYDCEHPLIHAAMYYQHKARLDILKGAVEFALFEKHRALPPARTINVFGIEAPADFLPRSFHNAVQQIQSIDGFEKLAVLWQSFLWKWGGFFLIDKEDEEKAALAREVGMATKAVDAAIAVYDTLFETSQGWFRTLEGTKLLILFPCQFRGLGVHYRLGRMGTDSLDEAFGSLPHHYLLANLARWNNSTVELLQQGQQAMKKLV